MNWTQDRASGLYLVQSSSGNPLPLHIQMCAIQPPASRFHYVVQRCTISVVASSLTKASHIFIAPGVVGNGFSRNFGVSPQTTSLFAFLAANNWINIDDLTQFNEQPYDSNSGTEFMAAEDFIVPSGFTLLAGIMCVNTVANAILTMQALLTIDQDCGAATGSNSVPGGGGRLFAAPSGGPTFGSS